ncbi:P-loop containing nucleoside triphosphate hydrolase protein, partial [Obelidium mucronatum]
MDPTLNPQPTPANMSDEVEMTEILKSETRRLVHHSCRPYQIEGVIAALKGYDVIAIQPTGSGKTWMFSITAILHRTHNSHRLVKIKGAKVAVVVSPLTALIHQQVAYFNSLSADYCAAALGSEDKDKDALMLVKNREVILVWMTPEYLEYVYSSRPGAAVAYKIIKESVWLWILDEVHLFIDAGDTWRLSYKQLSSLRDSFPAPIMALSASIPHEMINNLKSELNIQNANLCELVGRVDRPNVCYEVRKRTSPSVDFQFLIEMLSAKSHPPEMFPCIIYCNNKQILLKVAGVLAQACGNDERLVVFTADSSKTEKEAIISNISSTDHKHLVILATTALGVGMNPHGIRLVIHYICPLSFCDIFQESGRAGRDGSASDHILFFKDGDIKDGSRDERIFK